VAVLRDALGRQKGKLDDLHAAVPQPRLEVGARPRLREHDGGPPRRHVPQVGVLRAGSGLFYGAWSD